jgi:hypothetical protein
MELFYTVVLSIAVIMLILLLVLFGLMNRMKQTKQSFPPTQNDCPDYWTKTVNSSGVNVCKAGNVNVGSGFSSITGSKNANGSMSIFNSNTGLVDATEQTIAFSDAKWGEYYSASNQCALKSWTNANNINWDGVSNFNGC